MGVLTTKLTPENEEPWLVLIITNMINNSETTWGKEHFSQSSKPIEVMSKKESEFLTEKMYWHLKTKIYRNAVFSEKKKQTKKPGVTLAALEVAPEAAQMKLEIQ